MLILNVLKNLLFCKKIVLYKIIGKYQTIKKKKNEREMTKIRKKILVQSCKKIKK